MAHRIIAQLDQLRAGRKIDPRSEWITESRRLLLVQMKNTLPVKANPPQTAPLEQAWNWLANFMSVNMAERVVRPLAVLVIVLLVATQLVNNVDAAYEALPGDWLYPAKRAAEQTQVAVVAMMGDQNGETKLHIKFAGRRAEETKKILQRDVTTQNTAQAVATVADLKVEIATVNQKLNDAGTSGLGADVAKDVKQNSEQIKDVLQDVKNNLSVSTSTANSALSQAVSETKNLVKDVSVKAVEVLVSKQLAGDASVSKEEVAKVVATTLQSAASDANMSKQNVDGVKTIIDAVKTEVKDLTTDFKKQGNENLNVVTTSKQFSDQINVVANQTVAAVLQTEAVSAQVQKSVIEGQALLSTGDLTKAVDKIKEANQASQTAEKISDQSLQTIQSVLPIVQVIKDNNPVVSPSTSTVSGAVFVKPVSIIMTTGTFVFTTTTGGATTFKTSTSTIAPIIINKR